MGATIPAPISGAFALSMYGFTSACFFFLSSFFFGIYPSRSTHAIILSFFCSRSTFVFSLVVGQKSSFIAHPYSFQTKRSSIKIKKSVASVKRWRQVIINEKEPREISIGLLSLS